MYYNITISKLYFLFFFWAFYWYFWFLFCIYDGYLIMRYDSYVYGLWNSYLWFYLSFCISFVNKLWTINHKLRVFIWWLNFNYVINCLLNFSLCSSLLHKLYGRWPSSWTLYVVFIIIHRIHALLSICW